MTLFMLKPFILILFFGFNLQRPAYSTNLKKKKFIPNELLICLAKEEESLHKKKSQSALYHLNQIFINEIASANDIAINKKYLPEVCQNKEYSPSVAFLRLLLLKNKEIYELNTSGKGSELHLFLTGRIDEFQKMIPQIFIQYISLLQQELATPHCLENAINEIKAFNQKFKHLEAELSFREIVSEKSTIENIFKKLLKYHEIKKNCQIEAEKSMEKIKNKAHSKS